MEKKEQEKTSGSHSFMFYVNGFFFRLYFSLVKMSKIECVRYAFHKYHDIDDKIVGTKRIA